MLARHMPSWLFEAQSGCCCCLALADFCALPEVTLCVLRDGLWRPLSLQPAPFVPHLVACSYGRAETPALHACHAMLRYVMVTGIQPGHADQRVMLVPLGHVLVDICLLVAVYKTVLHCC
jgi:hypothetical protein